MYAEGSRSLRWTVLGFVTAAALVATGLVVRPAGAAPGLCDTTDEAETLIVTARSQKARYEVGSVAKLHVTVSRAADGYSGLPAEGVDVVAGVSLRDTYLAGSGVTDELGKATIKVRIRKFARIGLAEVDIRATRQHVDGPCVQLHEHGHLLIPKMFSVHR